MIKLRVVGSSTDLENLILTSRKQGRRGSHVVAIDEKLFRTLEDVVRKRRAKKGEPVRRVATEPKLAPREVQRLLRAGRPVDQIAKLAGMDVAWIERFLGPVLDERTVAIQDAQRARLEKPRLGLSSLPLGEAVARNLRARRVRVTEAELATAWDASRSDSQPWVISLTFSYRGRDQRAVWRFDPRTGEVSAANRLGSDIGWVAETRRVPAPSPKKLAARKPAAGKPAARKPAARKPAAKKKRGSATKRRAATKRGASGTKRRAATKRGASTRRRAAKTTSRRRATVTRRTPAGRRTPPKRRTPARRASTRARR